MYTTTGPKQPQQLDSLTSNRLVWMALFGSILLPFGLSRLPIAWPHISLAWLAPQILANLAYGLGITLSAAALMLRRHSIKHNLYGSFLVSAALAESVAWLGFAAWLADNNTPAFHTLLAMSAIVFWLIRPRTDALKR